LPYPSSCGLPLNLTHRIRQPRVLRSRLRPWIFYAAQPDFRTRWNRSIFQRCTYRRMRSKASPALSTSSLVIGNHLSLRHPRAGIPPARGLSARRFFVTKYAPDTDCRSRFYSTKTATPPPPSWFNSSSFPSIPFSASFVISSKSIFRRALPILESPEPYII